MYLLIVVVSVLAILGGLALMFGAVPVLLLAGGAAVLAWVTRQEWSGDKNV